VKLPTSSTLLSSFSSNTSSLLTTETSLTRKRKAETLESSVTTRVTPQESLKKTTASTTIALPDDSDERKYNAENIQPIPTEPIHLAVDLHCYVPPPKRPRTDPFSSIFAKLENTSDDDFNVGIKSIKV
jgi:hypothetical protein